MSKIFLISANTSQAPYPVYPLGIAYIARSLVDAGHDVFQYDIQVHGSDTLETRIRDFAPDFIGISLRNVDNVDSLTVSDEWYVEGLKTIIAAVRRVSDAPVILGGAGFSLIPKPILDYTGADFGVAGEGEETLLGLIHDLENGGSPGRIFKAHEPLRPNEIKIPLRQKDLMEYYENTAGPANIQTKRGCPNGCIYCSYPLLEGKRIRTRPIEQVIEELEEMKIRFGVREFFITDSVFNDAQGSYLELAEAMLRKDLQMQWTAYFQPKGMDRGKFSLLKKAGLKAAEVGVDASCDGTLKAVGKHFTYIDVAAFHAAAQAETVPCAYFFIFGGPDETPDTVEQGLENIDSLHGGVHFVFSGIRIHPGTQLQRMAVESGSIDPDDDLLRPVFYFSPHIDPQQMNARITERFKGKRGCFFPPEKGEQRMEVLKRFGYRGVLWDTLATFPAKEGA